MKKLFLTSQFSAVADKFARTFPNHAGMKVAFVPTAGNNYETKPWMDADREALVELGMDIEDLDLVGKTEEDVYNMLMTKDAVFVAGGNTFYLLYHSRDSGFGLVVKKLVEKGLIYIGSSAGSVLAGPTIEPVKVFDDPSEAPALATFDGLSLTDLVVLPHYKKEREDVIQNILKEWKGRATFELLSDTQALYTEGTTAKVL